MGWDKPWPQQVGVVPSGPASLSEPPTIPGQVLKSCAAVPEVIEVLFNSYSQIPVSREWAEAMPQEVFQVRQLCWLDTQGGGFFPTELGFIFPKELGFIFPPEWFLPPPPPHPDFTWMEEKQKEYSLEQHPTPDPSRFASLHLHHPQTPHPCPSLP